ncbi:MAG: ATPase, T2SS/T4P/T4SS family [Bowdeniella nasicola]|nr:ATPase, T2SS/T4P/T4SS family [Bowdeniella nasicola]
MSPLDDHPRGASRAHLAASHREANARRAGLTGALLDLLEDPAVTDVLVNPDGAVWVERSGTLARTSLTVRDTRALAVRLAASAGRRLDDAAPLVDGTILGSVRLHALLPPLSGPGAVICLRTTHQRSLTLEALVAGGALHPAAAVRVRTLLARGANVVVSGATGTGKTTLLSACLGEVGTHERLLIIEEAHELDPSHPHVVRLQARGANAEGAGEVSMSELVRAALRMRPDRLVLGEARGAEIREVLAALNTGHAGCWFTLHANTPDDVPARLHALGALAGLTDAALRAQVVAAIHAVVHLRRRGSRRYLADIGVVSAPDGPIVVTPALSVAADGRLLREDDDAFARLLHRIDPGVSGDGGAATVHGASGGRHAG